MAINERLIDTAVAGGDSFTQEVDGLILHLDANNVDSYDGDGDEWVDISTFNINPNTLTQAPPALSSPTPLISYATNDAESYIGTTTWKNLSSATYNASLGGATFSEADGSSLYFDDTTGDSVTTTYSSTGKSAVTWEGWFNLDQVGALEALGTFSVNGGNVAIFAHSTSTNTSEGYFDYVYVKHADLVGNWTHIAVKFTGWAGSYTTSAYGAGISAEVYINGSSTGTVTVTPYGQTSTYNTVFRVMGSVTTYRAKGLLSEFRFYESGLSDADVLANYNHGRVNFNELKTTDLELHLDAASFDGSTNTPSTWTDSSGNSNNGTITGATFDSELGNYLDFDGINDKVTTSYTTNDTDFTVEGWMKNENTFTGRYHFLCEKGYYSSGSDTQYFFLGHYAAATPAFRVRNDSTSITATSSTSLEIGKWYHYCGVKSGSNLTLYINGQEVATQTGAPTISPAQAVTLGANLETYYLDGYIGQFRYYSTVLSANQVKGNYLATANLYPNGYDGVLGGGTTSNKPTWNSGGYFDFDGSNDYVDLTGQAPFSNSTAQTDTIKSITGWLKPETSTSRVFPYAVSSSASHQYYFQIGWFNDLNFFRLNMRNGANSQSSNKQVTITPTTDWVHFVIQVTNTTTEMYINGNSQTVTFTNTGSGTNDSWISFPTYQTNAKHTIGRSRLVTPSYTDGKISKLKMFDKVLSQAEITALHSEGR